MRLQRIDDAYMFARDAQFLELESSCNKQLTEVTNFSFKLANMSFNPSTYALQELWYPNLHCKNKTKQELPWIPFFACITEKRSDRNWQQKTAHFNLLNMTFDRATIWLPTGVNIWKREYLIYQTETILPRSKSPNYDSSITLFSHRFGSRYIIRLTAHTSFHFQFPQHSRPEKQG